MSHEKCKYTSYSGGLEKHVVFCWDFTRLSDVSCQISLAINFSKPLCNIFRFLPSRSFLLRNTGLGEAGGKDLFSSGHSCATCAQLERPGPGRGSAGRRRAGSQRDGLRSSYTVTSIVLIPLVVTGAITAPTDVKQWVQRDPASLRAIFR